MILKTASTVFFFALLITGCGEYRRVTGRHAHNAPSAPNVPRTGPEADHSATTVDACASNQLKVSGSPDTCVDQPQAWSLNDLKIQAFADDDLDKRCQGINDFLTAFVAHADSLKFSDYKCRLMPSFASDDGAHYVVDFTVTRADAQKLVFSLYVTMGNAVQLQLDTIKNTTNGSQSSTYSTDAYIYRADYDFSVPMLRLSPSLKLFFNTAATKAPSMFGKPYADVIKQACSDIEKTGLPVEDSARNKSVTMNVAFGTCASGATSGMLTVSAIPTDFFTDLTANAQHDNGFLGYITSADVLAATDITWSFTNDTLTLARRMPRMPTVGGQETVAVSYKITP